MRWEGGRGREMKIGNVRWREAGRSKIYLQRARGARSKIPIAAEKNRSMCVLFVALICWEAAGMPAPSASPSFPDASKCLRAPCSISDLVHFGLRRGAGQHLQTAVNSYPEWVIYPRNRSCFSLSLSLSLLSLCLCLSVLSASLSLSLSLVFSLSRSLSLSFSMPS